MIVLQLKKKEIAAPSVYVLKMNFNHFYRQQFLSSHKKNNGKKSKFLPLFKTVYGLNFFFKRANKTLVENFIPVNFTTKKALYNDSAQNYPWCKKVFFYFFDLKNNIFKSIHRFKDRQKFGFSRLFSYNYSKAAVYKNDWRSYSKSRHLKLQFPFF